MVRSFVVALLAACAPADPPGTAIASLRIPGQGANTFSFLESRAAQCCDWATVDLILDENLNLSIVGGNGNLTEGGIVDVGEVAGVGAIAAPSTRFLRSTAAVDGHGYVFRTFEQELYRFRIEEFAESTSGGILGLRMKWAPLRTVTSATISGPTSVALGEQASFTVTTNFSDGTSEEMPNIALTSSNRAVGQFMYVPAQGVHSDCKAVDAGTTQIEARLVLRNLTDVRGPVLASQTLTVTGAGGGGGTGGGTAERAAERAAEPVAEPVAERAAEPVAERAAERAAERVAAPAARTSRWPSTTRPAPGPRRSPRATSMATTSLTSSPRTTPQAR